MRVPALLLVSSLLLAAPSAADASGGRQGGRPARAQRQQTPEERQAEYERHIVRTHLRARKERVQRMGSIFSRIATAGHRQGEYVLHQDRDVTAFLDISDPQHPGFDPEQELEEGDELAAIPPAKRAHILVVPNAPREHITRVIGGAIGENDIEEVASVMRSARQLATRLGIKNPRIYMNPESRVAIGYLHVHIIGERPSKPYPAALQ